MSPYQIPFPHALPSPNLNAVLRGVIDNTGVPIDLAAVATLAATSIAAQDRFDVEGPVRSVVPLAIFGLVVAASNERKSTVMKLVLKSVNHFEQQGLTAFEANQSEHRAAHAIWKAKRAGAERAIVKAVERGNDSSTLESAFAELVASEPQLPRPPRLLFENVTVEALLDAMGSGSPSAGLISAEGSNFFGGSIGSLLAPLCSLWSGDPLRVDRVTKPPVVLTGDQRLTGCIMTQPEPLQEFMKKHGAKAEGLGFTARFLVCQPVSKQGFRPVYDGPVHSPGLENFDTLVANLLAMPRKPRATLHLSAPARQRMYNFTVWCESMSHPASIFADIRSAVGKSPEQAARLAGLLHIIEGGSADTQISEMTMASAIDLAVWFLKEFKRMFGLSAVPQCTEDTNALDTWFCSYSQNHPGVKEVKRNLVSQSGPPVFRGDSNRRNAALEAMRANGRIYFLTRGKTQYVQLNPNFFPNAVSTARISGHASPSYLPV